MNVDVNVGEEAKQECNPDESDITDANDKGKKYCLFRYLDTHTPSINIPDNFKKTYKWKEQIKFTGAKLNSPTSETP
mgnify:CR=1 FL=1